MLKFLSILLLTFSTFSTFAGVNARCTEWVKQDRVSCLFAGSSADSYLRQCENPCVVDHLSVMPMDQSCDQEEVCHFNNPKTFEGPCSEWTKDGNSSCYDSSTQSYEQRWVRACTVGLIDTWCSRQKPF